MLTNVLVSDARGELADLGDRGGPRVPTPWRRTACFLISAYISTLLSIDTDTHGASE